MDFPLLRDYDLRIRITINTIAIGIESVTVTLSLSVWHAQELEAATSGFLADCPPPHARASCLCSHVERIVNI